jgi:acetyltransferase-like isoleucine patch superfamily enzyme
MQDVYRFLALSDHWLARTARWLYQVSRTFTLPAPRIVVQPLLGVFLLLRSLYFFTWRVLVCEPLFKAYCKQYGRRVRTGVFIHWIQGKGDIILGNDVVVDGKCNLSFAVRFTSRPELIIGDHTSISHNCTFSIGKRITIGQHCRIASDVVFFDSSGHTTDPEGRQRGLPPDVDEVRPIVVEDNVWIGRRAIIFPGVTVGRGSVVSAGSVVVSDVAPFLIVAGNPARKIASLTTTEAPDIPLPSRNGS